jgi:hypothetical protein
MTTNASVTLQSFRLVAVSLPQLRVWNLSLAPEPEYSVNHHKKTRRLPSVGHSKLIFANCHLRNGTTFNRIPDTETQKHVKKKRLRNAGVLKPQRSLLSQIVFLLFPQFIGLGFRNTPQNCSRFDIQPATARKKSIFGETVVPRVGGAYDGHH